MFRFKVWGLGFRLTRLRGVGSVFVQGPARALAIRAKVFRQGFEIKDVDNTKP